MSYPAVVLGAAGFCAVALLALAACASDGPTAFQSDSTAAPAAATSSTADSAGRTAAPQLSEASGPACASTPAGAIGWWPGEGSADDIVGGQHGTLRNGAGFAPGLVGQGFSFDGVDDYMQLGDVLPNDAGTVEFWVNHRSGDGNFIGSYFDRTPTLANIDGQLVWEIGSQHDLAVGRPLSHGEWHHLAVTWARPSPGSSAVEAVAYVDGEAAATTSATVADFARPAVGSYIDGTWPANSLIDELTIYGRPLAAGEIAAIVAARGAGKCDNQAPAAQAGGPYAAAEGTAVTVDGTASSDPDGQALTYTWNFGDATPEESGPASTHATRTHAYADEGSYIVTLTVSDGRLSAQATATAAIANAAPVVQTGADASIPLGGSFTLVGSFTDPGTGDAPWSYAITWGDQSAASTGSTTTPGAIGQSHAFAAAGIYPITLAVTDADGATGSDVLTLSVLYPFSGFFSPVDNAPTVNKVSAGRAVPVKFGLGGDQGTAIFLPGYPKAVSYRCDGGSEDTIEETVAASTSGLTYDAGTAQYTYTWKTEKGWADGCRELQLGLRDGSDRRARFHFVK